MKVAIFHNFLDNIGGAEIVSLILARELKADIFTTNIDEEKIKLMGFGDVFSRIKSIGKVPLNAPFRQQKALFLFRKLNLGSEYDFYIIAGDWAMSGAFNHRPNLWYVHSPIREIWDLYRDTRNKLNFLLRPVFDVWVFLNRYFNKKYLSKVERLVCNSKNTQKRIKKYLNRKAKIIYPPIETKYLGFKKSGNYWLSVNRLINHKRIELQLEAFKKMPDEKLIIVGSYEKSRHFLEYANKCLKNKPKNVEILSWVNKKDLIQLYSNCKGFITTSKDEDFGMNVVEAISCGKPVLAPNEGGYKETLIEGKTGFLIDEINSDKIVFNIKKVNSLLKKEKNYFKQNCLLQAKRFDTKVFIKKIKEVLNEKA